MNESIWQRAFNVLKDEGINIYPPATKTGECKEKYCVLKGDGSSQIGNLSSQVEYYTILLYVPRERYTDLAHYRKEVEKVFAEKLYPMLMPTGQVTPDFYDDTVKAHMVSVMYRTSVRNKQL